MRFWPILFILVCKPNVSENNQTFLSVFHSVLRIQSLEGLFLRQFILGNQLWWVIYLTPKSTDLLISIEVSFKIMYMYIENRLLENNVNSIFFSGYIRFLPLKKTHVFIRPRTLNQAYKGWRFIPWGLYILFYFYS